MTKPPHPAGPEQPSWEERHQARYGQEAWCRAAGHADVLLTWHLEHTKSVRRLLPRSRDRERAERGALALVLWRAARGRDVLVDHTPMNDALLLCKTAQPAALLEEPVPLAPIWTFPVPSHLSRGTLSYLARVLRGHLRPAGAPDRPTDKDATVGYRVREVMATKGWTFGSWSTAVDSGLSGIGLARYLLLDNGPAGRADRAALARIGLLQPPAYDYPAEPTADEAGHPSWLQRAHHVVGLGASLRAVMAEPLPEHEPVSEVLKVALTGCADAFERLQDTMGDLEQEWMDATSRPEPVAYGDWEHHHIPCALQDQLTQLERLAGALTQMLTELERTVT